MKQLFASAFIGVLASTTVQAETYSFDPGHTQVQFHYNHAGLSEQSGEWKVIGGSVEFDAENIDATSVNVTIDASSIDTGVTALNEHLKSEDFFEVEKYPEITFSSTGVKQTGTNTITVTGDLTIKDKTLPTSFDFTLNHNGPHPLGGFFEYYEGQWIGVQGGGVLLRSDYGLGMFAPTTSDRVRLAISAELRAGGWE